MAAMLGLLSLLLTDVFGGQGAWEKTDGPPTIIMLLVFAVVGLVAAIDSESLGGVLQL